MERLAAMPGLSPSRVLGPGGATGPGELEESSRGSEPLVLVADDEATVRELICEVLAPSGYRTLSASNGREASTSRPDTTPSLIVVDVMMPAMDGYATVARLRDDLRRRLESRSPSSQVRRARRTGPGARGWGPGPT